MEYINVVIFLRVYLNCRMLVCTIALCFLDILQTVTASNIGHKWISFPLAVSTSPFIFCIVPLRVRCADLYENAATIDHTDEPYIILYATISLTCGL